jgi:hypothetical protein
MKLGFFFINAMAALYVVYVNYVAGRRSNAHTAATSSMFLTSFTSSISDRLPILLELRDELITLFDYIVVLLVLVVGSVGFDHLIDSVNRAWHTVGRNKI